MMGRGRTAPTPLGQTPVPAGLPWLGVAAGALALLSLASTHPGERRRREWAAQRQWLRLDPE